MPISLVSFLFNSQIPNPNPSRSCVSPPLVCFNQRSALALFNFSSNRRFLRWSTLALTPVPFLGDTCSSIFLQCHTPICRLLSIPSPSTSDPPLSGSVMLYLVDEVPSSNFLFLVDCFLLPLSTMDSILSRLFPAPSFDHGQRLSQALIPPTPSDPSRDPPLLPTPPGLSRTPPPHPTNPSNQPSSPFEMDLVRSLEAL
jgi:hypothetical protein